ncbi:YgcG family protein [Bradyrhizobium sp.]|uniref:TPM domain-containing protein n=1 Tax=Bradyrhizobium sp. TaxID=376 RepID=UPI0023A1B158|nr:YgcG family protein [Bradyrhizobium sp.]MDE2380414.1 YgcG family protein [Bradyrhizobium sp.]
MRAARVLLLALLLGFAFTAAAEVAVPQLTGRVVDQTGTLGAGDVASLTQKLRDFETRKGSQIAVLIVPTTQPETIEQFSIRVAEAWKVGRKKIDDGAILVIAKNDRHLRIEVGYGLEGSLTDATSRRIIDEDITPKFKSGDFAGGIAAGVDRMIRVVDGEALPAPEPPHWKGSDVFSGIDPFNPFLLIAVFMFGGLFRGIFGRLLGSLTAGGLVGVVAWFIAGSIAASLLAGGVVFLFTLLGDSIFSGGGPGVGRKGSSGGWSGGGSGGGWSSGSSSDSGGFSGGGGSFGGGGASGSW